MPTRELWEQSLLSTREAFKTGKVDALDEFYSPDVVISNAAFPPVNGLDAFKQMITGSRKAFSDIWYENEETIIDGNNMANRFTFHAKITAPLSWLPVKNVPIGKEVYWKAVIFCHAENDKITEIIEVSNYLSLIQQLSATD